MECKNPVDELSSVRLIPFSPEYKERYKELYNDYYREMRETLNIKPYDYIQNNEEGSIYR